VDVDVGSVHVLNWQHEDGQKDTEEIKTAGKTMARETHGSR
jgi:hypothetical protein